jgi:hypothetical protein
MAIHLIFLAANKFRPGLGGKIRIHLDCLGALDKVTTLPNNRIPKKCSHSNILKNIMVNCRQLTFDIEYLHIRAHQDDKVSYHELSRPSQLKCIVDIKAKRVIWVLEGKPLLAQQAFPLEPMAIFVDEDKMTSDTGKRIRYWAHKALTEITFNERGILSMQAFREVAWCHVYDTLHGIPRLFQLWACKQVMGIAGTNASKGHHPEGHDPLCPSCGSVHKTCAHLLHCDKVGRLEALRCLIECLDNWLKKENTEPRLRKCLVTYAKGRGRRTMMSIVGDWEQRFRLLALSQDAIGWRRFMEGMISQEIIDIQADHMYGVDSCLALAPWARGLIVKLLEATHGQWLYRNVKVHDAATGTLATKKKEEIQHWIEDQIELGEAGLEEKDNYLLEVNLENLETTSAEEHHYWLLHIDHIRRRHKLREETGRQNQSGTCRGQRA